MIAALNGFTQQIIAANGVKMNTVTGGEGPPIVLIHGFPQTWWEWHRVMPLLAARFSVVAVDLRGAGFSECPLDGYDKATLARDVHEVMSALGHERYAVCGHDIGGMVALALAATHRDAVSHLAILDVPLPGWSEWEATAAKLWHFAFHMNRDLAERLIYGREYDYVSAFIAERIYDHNSYDPADIDIYARALALPGRTRGGMEWYRSFDADHAAALEYKRQPLDVPVLALGGDQRFGSRMVPMLEEFATNVTGGAIERCSHYVPDERPNEVASALIAFLSAH
ncbi:alpha/beta fold hydrolase [Aurantimonas endophytica]|uniref:Pimeloyl-ACP methyl ester carboxylesterase n=1 Tax=Aurantimonas endophytica TaxID=1522175 RepID=A0A7W6HGB4_9HYPH|nr:alpha/beta hydrolase [Aurantimonas endophytica]MBB4004612.1 pimeloyl-ACP methyl ester carboxylesterase [Aurantimonas endophytica]MCO6405445.1 alpha/beta fold hydrolase [Aurantimonas endophytica]